ncbi:ABC transporter permease [Kosmotoga pacifica]|uniref:Peptide ABC transporter permease n=1 Tax=Kosmotoga pacifica TaxID=1330330 RepID=A0A0G2Z9T0_9BACT|nr:ABC transporter permease [Kosmotoga pacifica]AKI96846.1 peptide ABC transporter permease [Kosmotoga pacifica]
MQEWSLSYKLGKGLRRLFKDKSGVMAFVGLAILLTYLFMAIFAPYLAPYDPVKRSGRAFSAPSKEHWFGTTNLGYDVLSRIIYGAKIALKIAFLAVAVAAAVGIPLGLISGYVGGAFDRILSMFMDAIYSFPGLILAIAIAAVLGPGVINVALSIAVIYAPTYFRVIRNQVASLKDQLFVEAARAMGARNFTILGKYILPNVLPSVIVVLSMNLADAIMTEAGLSFLGLGISPPTPDWGYDLSNGQRFLLLNYWWMILFPGLAIITIVLGFSLFSEGLNEFLNPNVGETRR